jgi:MHS family proline/betaine transporter-like MFS transporter
MTAAEIELEPDAKAAVAPNTCEEEEAVGGASIEAEVEASGGGGSSRSTGEEASLMPVGLSDSCAFDNSKKSFSLEISASDAIERELGPPPSSSLRNLIISSVFGNMLEWYDFGVFASFSAEISKSFFTGGRLEEILKVYGVFAVAFFARPLGGFILGLIGDKYARTLSLQISVVAMGFSALIISIMPTNSVGKYSIGPTASILLVLVRIIQGLSVGGEMVGSMLYMVENVPQNWKCVVSCVPMASAIAGTGTGYLVSALITALLSEEARILWGWRLAFALGVPAGAVGFMFRSCLSESHTFTSAIKKFSARHQNQHPFFYALRFAKLPFVTLSAISMAVCGFYSATIWYNQTWLEEFYTELIGEELALSQFQGRILNTLLIYFGLAGGSMLMAVVIDKRPDTPLFHYIAFSGGVLAVMTPFLLWLISFDSACPLCVLGGQLGGMLCFVPCIAPLALWLVSQFPVQLQYTSIALSYNIAQAIFGGTMPFIATSMISSSKNVLTPSFYLSALALVGLASVLLSRLQRVQRMREDISQVMNT